MSSKSALNPTVDSVGASPAGNEMLYQASRTLYGLHRHNNKRGMDTGTVSKATLGKRLRRGGAHMCFSECIDSILNWTGLNNKNRSVFTSFLIHNIEQQQQNKNKNKLSWVERWVERVSFPVLWSRDIIVKRESVKQLTAAPLNSVGHNQTWQRPRIDRRHVKNVWMVSKMGNPGWYRHLKSSISAMGEKVTGYAISSTTG